MKQIFRAAMYERLSKEDGDQAESESILTQQIMLEEYCRQHADVIPVRHYSDDGYSGTSFMRPAFQNMLKDVKAGDINCVIVKDLSRFGRDYIEMGRFFERIFPAYEVRFISVNDRIDSMEQPYSMLMPVTNVFHTQYARDISQKVRSAIKGKHQSGQFTGPSAPYGYTKSTHDHNRLVIDEKTAKTVKAIYQQYLNGMGKTAIASWLNQQGVLSPGQQRIENGFYKGEMEQKASKLFWNSLAVHRILNDPVYIGNMRTGKTRNEQMNGKKKTVRKDDWIVVENKHEGIIPYSVWEQVQTLLRERKRDVFPTDKTAKNLFTGLLFCGTCNRRMKLFLHHGERAYFCSAYKTAGPSACSSHKIKESNLTQLVLQDVNAIISQIPDIEKLFCAPESKNRDTQSCETEYSLRTRIAGVSLRKQEAYEKYKEGRLSRSAFSTLKQQYEQQQNTLQTELAVVCSHTEKEMPEWLESIKNEHMLEQLNREALLSLVERIVVGSNGEITIVYKFKELYK